MYLKLALIVNLMLFSETKTPVSLNAKPNSLVSSYSRLKACVLSAVLAVGLIKPITCESTLKEVAPPTPSTPKKPLEPSVVDSSNLNADKPQKTLLGLNEALNLRELIKILSPKMSKEKILALALVGSLLERKELADCSNPELVGKILEFFDTIPLSRPFRTLNSEQAHFILALLKTTKLESTVQFLCSETPRKFFLTTTEISAWILKCSIESNGIVSKAIKADEIIKINKFLAKVRELRSTDLTDQDLTFEEVYQILIFFNPEIKNNLQHQNLKKILLILMLELLDLRFYETDENYEIDEKRSLNPIAKFNNRITV